jgi:hypothetical protein
MNCENYKVCVDFGGTGSGSETSPQLFLSVEKNEKKSFENNGCGAATLGITTFSRGSIMIMAFGKMIPSIEAIGIITLNIITLTIMVLSIITFGINTLSIMILNIIILRVMTFSLLTLSMQNSV